MSWLASTRNPVAEAIQSVAGTDGLSDVMGIALWASVSEVVHAKIRAQIKPGVFTVRPGTGRAARSTGCST